MVKLFCIVGGRLDMNNNHTEDDNRLRGVYEKRRKKAKKRKLALLLRISFICLMLFMLVVGVFLAMKYTPTKEHMDAAEYFVLQDKEVATIFNGEYMNPDDGEYNAYNSDGNLYLALNFVKSNLDDGYVYDKTERIMRYVTDRQVYTVEINHPDYLIDRAQSTISHNILIEEKNTVFVAVEFLQLLTDFEYTFAENPDRMSINTPGYVKKMITASKDIQVRRKAGVKSPVLEDVPAGGKMEVINVIDDWNVVLTENNIIGCIRNKKISAITEETVEAKLEERVYNHIKLDGTINMAWQQITNKSQNKDIAKVLAGTKNLDVISPTWFVLSSEQGDISSDASPDYVSYCHSKGVQVWPTFNNIELKDQVDTSTVLNTTSSRDALVNNLITQAISLDLDGINVDLESVGKDAKDGYIEFIKELSLKCENNNIILSVDNYVPSEFTAHYNRAEQAKYVDYVVIMAYDEHYVGGPSAGSTASREFVKNGIENTLKSVPKEQVILGMPFYCRLWCTEPNGNLTSTAYGIVAAREHVKYKAQANAVWDEETGQNYVEYNGGDLKYQMWMEDETSLEWKLKFLDEYKLAGASYWRLGFEDSSVWDLISKYL